MYSVLELRSNPESLMDMHSEMIWNNVIIPSMRDHSLINPSIINISSNDFVTMQEIAEEANRVLIKVSNLYLQKKINNFHLNIPNKVFIEKDVSELENIFLARADVFRKQNGGFFIAEINYDKPSGHKETQIESYFDEVANNPNADFQKKFAEGLITRFNEYYKGKETKIKVALVCDPYKYEEITLGDFYKQSLSEYGIELDVVSYLNIKFQSNKVTAFDKAYNVILRKFPIEFNHEFPAFGAMNEMYQKGDLLILNESRAIIPQNKDIFSVLWALLETDLLTNEEKVFIQNYIPFTVNFKDFMKQQMTDKHLVQKLRNEQSQWIIKEVFTRYSEGVYLGKEMHPNDWYKTIIMAMQKPELFILQKFVQIQNEPFDLIYSNEKSLISEQKVAYENIKDIVWRENEAMVKGYINYGVHLINGEYAGIFARCSPTLVTKEDTVFLMPINIL